MAKQRATAYYMHEPERNAAVAKFTNAEVTDSFIEGDIDDADIPELVRSGVIVQVIQPLPEPPKPNTRFRFGEVFTASVLGGPAGSIGRAAGDSFNDIPAAVDYYEVRLDGPLVESRRQSLETLGVSLLEAQGHRHYKARLSTAQVPAVKALPFVEDVTWLSPDESAPTVVTAALPPGAGASGAGLKMLTFDVRLRNPDERAAIEGWIKDRGLAVAGTSQRKIRLYALENSEELLALARLPGVDRISEYVPPKLFNQAARRILGVDAAPGASPAQGLQQDGAGQLVAVADTGIDDTHPDFAGRIVAAIDRGGRGVANDPNGHGTHVAGSVLGSGAASGGTLKGVAPAAKLFFQSLLDPAGHLGGLPLDLNDLFDEAYNAGARIHNNSWGSATSSTYTVSSEEVDEYIYLHPDMLVVVAAGNEGVSANPLKAAKGFVDWLSIGSPASCKNALTVGASRSDRTDGALMGRTWGDSWPSAFPDPPIAKESVSGDPDRLAAFSSRGPCDDRRIKPDVVAPGTDIASTKSSLAPITNYWGSYPATPGATPDPRYAFDGGTSMATPLVSGCAALLRQYYVDVRHHAPSAALLKATLINSTTRLSGADAIAPDLGEPNYHQGHGRVNMRLAIPNPSEPTLALQFVDDWQDATKQFTMTGERRRWMFVLPVGTLPLRLCLAYTDLPARGLQNNLNVLVHHQESGTKWMGNANLPAALVLPDPDNNVETVRIPQPKPGTYFVQVFAANLLKGPQGFALVVTGSGLPALTQI